MSVDTPDWNRLPPPQDDGAALMKRCTLVLEEGRISCVFAPVFPPDQNAAAVVRWLSERRVL